MGEYSQTLTVLFITSLPMYMIITHPPPLPPPQILQHVRDFFSTEAHTRPPELMLSIEHTHTHTHTLLEALHLLTPGSTRHCHTKAVSCASEKPGSREDPRRGGAGRRRRGSTVICTPGKKNITTLIGRLDFRRK